ncbi:unnamed protein product [Orchesella dallaii]|uniref:Dynamin-1-like protein n=1 Tax=Orchesella dallaii TaxID=48710 RepID=A0ABP1REA3_9HEXA
MSTEPGVSDLPIDLDNRMEGLIPIFDKIQDILERTRHSDKEPAEIQLPQIVVIGSQSIGKSSVLESLVGQSFLPRGQGLVTRTPIILRMIHTSGGKPWCEFHHIDEDKKFTDFKVVEQEIVSRTAELAGNNLGIVSDSIKITIYSPNVLNLTVVDLPGIVQVPSGDQPEDIAEKVKELILQYISSENAIILAVCPGNLDVVNNESIKIARLVDPFQERTIVVLTKVDKAEDFAIVADILNGNVIPMKLGIIGVVNRSQEDILSNKPISEVLRSEKEFLKEKLGTLADKHGITNLGKKLNRILLQRILANISGLSTRIRSLVTANEAELKTLGQDGEISKVEKKRILFSIIDKFSKQYKAQIDGMSRSEIKSSSLTSGARIDFIITSSLQNHLDSMAPFSHLTDAEILITIRNSMPVGSRMINPEVALNYFIKEEIKRLKLVALHCCQSLHQEMVSMINKCLEGNKRFPNVNAAIESIVNELLSTKMELTNEVLETYFEIKSSSALTANQDYRGTFEKLMTPISVVDLGVLPVGMVFEGDGETENGEGTQDFTHAQLGICQQMRNLAQGVYKIILGQAQDYTINAIMTTLIYKTVDTVAVVLNSRLNESEDIADTLICESDEIHNKRVHLKQTLVEYQSALALLDKLRNTAC